MKVSKKIINLETESAFAILAKATKLASEGKDIINLGIGQPDFEINSYDGERKVVALINTHAHFDHSGHIPFFKQHYGLEWWLHSDDNYLQTLAKKSGERWGFTLPEPAVAENSWEHG